MHNIIKTVINTGNFELTSILHKIDTVWIEAKITDKEKEELVLLAQEKANHYNSIDLITKLEEMDKRIKALEDAKASENEEELEDVYPLFEDGKWYYNGDKIAFEGNKYVCIAPVEVVCVWNPSAYPVYWQLVE